MKSRGRKLLIFAGVPVLLFAGAWARTPLCVTYQRSKAQSALDRDDGRAALTRLRYAERLAPDDPETQFWLARATRRLGRLEEMEQHLARCARLGIAPERIRRERLLAEAQSGRVHRVQAYLPDLLQEPGEDGPEICRAFANGYGLDLRFAEALALLDAWQQDYPDDADPHFLRGRVWYSQQNWEPAAEAYRKGLEIAPQRAEARLRLAVCLLKMKRPADAEWHFRHFLRSDPSRVEGLVGLAQGLVDTSRPEEARGFLSQALKLDPDDGSARLLLGRLELSAGRPRQTIECVQPLIEAWPDDMAACYLLAQAWQALGDDRAADDYFDRVAAGHRALDRIRELTEAVSRNSQNVSLRHELGVLLLRFRSREEGVNWLRSALLIDPDHRPTHAILADYYAKRGDREAAEHHRHCAGAMEGGHG